MEALEQQPGFEGVFLLVKDSLLDVEEIAGKLTRTTRLVEFVDVLEDEGWNLIHAAQAFRDQFNLPPYEGKFVAPEPLPGGESRPQPTEDPKRIDSALVECDRLRVLLREVTGELNKSQKFVQTYRDQRNRLIPLVNEAMEAWRLQVPKVDPLVLDGQAEALAEEAPAPPPPVAPPVHVMATVTSEGKFVPSPPTAPVMSSAIPTL